ncbi:F-actin capping protein, beta subunit [Piedraia hortae CBS 480.64]|uniref:F-actin-capping protein subunit beta n=1 Tax=Piedraia hortae CBS 480.64 TaxID=1314780 RepID=A0A6A7BT91_9PEZI|nr:F-actin capping protein, beta subunit [Piedraia hortae CBS 480.64]
MADPFDAALDLLRRLPPSRTSETLTKIISLRPELEEDLLSSVDVSLTSQRCTKTGRDYLCCDYNRDGTSYRSPWSNEFEPPLPDADDDDLKPSGRIRRMEESLNSAIDVYRELYYDGGISSAYLWALDQAQSGFAGVILLQNRTPKGGEWDGIHVFEVEEAATKRSALYKLTSTVILDLQGQQKLTAGPAVELAGNLTRQTQADMQLTGFREAEIEKSHVANMGRMVEDMETRMRNMLQDVYFGKARDVVGDLRSLVPLNEVASERAAHRDVIEKMNR